MGKRHTTLTIDEELIERAKLQRMNVSATVNNLLEKALKPCKKNLPENSKKVFCSECEREIKRGFVCEPSQRVYCEDCHNGPDGKGGLTMLRCFHDMEGQHEHKKWGDWEEEDVQTP